MFIKDKALDNYKTIELDILELMNKNNTVNDKLKRLNTKLEQCKSNQKEILLERIKNREHTDVYTEMLVKCEADIKRIQEEIHSIKDYNNTIKREKLK